MRRYGNVDVSDTDLVVTTQPQVALRLKRCFPRIDTREFGVVRMRATPESAAELRWFCLRYPHHETEAARAHLDDLCRREEQRQRVLDRVVAGEYSARAFELAVAPRRYQAEAAEIALTFGGLLVADDVGLGKTATAIAALTDPSTRPALVVTLTHLPAQWAAELRKFAPTLRVHALRKGTPYPFPDPLLGLPDVILSNYHKLAGWAEELAGVVKGVVFDECQELRRDGSQKYAAARHVARQARLVLGLSATPIYNYGEEFFNVIDVLREGALGDRAEFLREWCHGGYRERSARIREPRAFGSYLRDCGLMVRRTRTDVGRELPACSSIPYTVDADLHTIEQAELEVAELARVILAQSGFKGFDRLRAAEELDGKMRLATGLAKATAVADFVRVLVEGGESVVLYGWHHDVYGVWRERLNRAGIFPVMFTGRESPTQKEAARKAFLEGKSKVLMMSLRAGAGLDGLQAVCRTLVFGELDWSPGVHEQCIGRIHRDGQGDPVCAYYLLADHGSDPVICDTLGLKTQQIAGVRDPSAALVERLVATEDRAKRLAESVLERTAGARRQSA